MSIPFKLKEFIITKPNKISLEIADKLYHYHIIPMIPVREEMGVSMTASASSGYRPKWWELRKGRSGNSQHVFREKGAVDWTCSNFETNWEKMLDLMIYHTGYTRFAIYNSFIHCDHAPTKSGKREVFESNSASEWTFLKHAE